MMTWKSQILEMQFIWLGSTDNSINWSPRGLSYIEMLEKVCSIFNLWLQQRLSNPSQILDARPPLQLPPPNPICTINLTIWFCYIQWVLCLGIAFCTIVTRILCLIIGCFSQTIHCQISRRKDLLMLFCRIGSHLSKISFRSSPRDESQRFFYVVVCCSLCIWAHVFFIGILYLRFLIVLRFFKKFSSVYCLSILVQAFKLCIRCTFYVVTPAKTLFDQNRSLRWSDFQNHFTDVLDIKVWWPSISRKIVKSNFSSCWYASTNQSVPFFPLQAFCTCMVEL